MKQNNELLLIKLDEESLESMIYMAAILAKLMAKLC